jgi:hypothetical protein
MCWKGLKLSCASSLGWSDGKLTNSHVRHLRFFAVTVVTVHLLISVFSFTWK